MSAQVPKTAHPCKCTGYNGGQCYNCLNGAHELCSCKPKCKSPNAKQVGLAIITQSQVPKKGAA
jgi:hypothetical protein